MISEPEDDRLDQSLRSKFEQFAPPPTGKVWPGIAPHIGPPPVPRRRRRPLPLPLLFGLTALLAGLAGWLLRAPMLPRPASRPQSAAGSRTTNTRAAAPAFAASDFISEKGKPVVFSPRQAVSNPGQAISNPQKAASIGRRAISNGKNLFPDGRQAVSNGGNPIPDGGQVVLNGGNATYPVKNPAADSLALAAASMADSLPPTLRPLAALEYQTLGQLPGIATLAAGPLEAESRTRFIGTLRRERAELLRLQRRTDSLLLALGDILPGAPALAARPDSTQPETKNQQPTTNRWSLLLTAAPEQNTLTLEGPAGDSLTALRRNHETGRAGFSAGLLAEYRFTPRLSVGGGVGYTSFGADLRITNKTTEVRVTYDTTTTRSTNVYTSTYQTHSIRIIQVPQLSPVFNGSGQVIRYDTVYVPRQDTVYTTTVQHDTTHATNRTITPKISQKETLTTRLLQPNYRFFTVPVLLRYRLAAHGLSRLWTDVALGAQLQFFLGGTQVVTDDGENFRTERITVGSSPFRALNVALSGSLALNYALTPRLSVSVAPSMRWQALSLYKPETGLRQQPTATGLLFGVRFGL